MKAFLNGISYYLPEDTLSNDQINREHPEWSVDKISEKTGIRSRHISRNDEFASTLAVGALNKLLAQYSIEKNNIDYLIVCTQSPDYIIPTTACIVQNLTGLSNSIGAIDINLGCSGFVYGLGLAKGLIMSRQASNIILVTSDTYSKYINSEDKSNKTIFGDGAAATFITSKPNSDYFVAEIEEFSYGTDGLGFDKLIVKNSGLRKGDNAMENSYDEKGYYVSNPNNLYMDGQGVFTFTAFQVPNLINAVLQANSMIKDDIDMNIFHQANEFMLDYIRKRCKIDNDKFFVSIEDIGNTVSSSIPIALYRYLNKLGTVTNHKILLAGFGVGFSMGGVILNLNKSNVYENRSL